MFKQEDAVIDAQAQQQQLREHAEQLQGHAEPTQRSQAQQGRKHGGHPCTPGVAAEARQQREAHGGIARQQQPAHLHAVMVQQA